jgi:DNA helicase IV
LFSRYISNVLPSLGETGAVTSTVGQLFPGIDTDTHDVKSVAKLKGDLVMSEVLSRVIASHQRHPQRVLIELTGRKLTLTARDIAEAYERTYRKNLSYNQGRVTFLRILIKRLTRKYLHQLGEGRVPDPEILKDVTEEIYGSVNARRELNLLWMPLTPQRILEELYTREDIRTLACEGLLTDAERDSLTRPKGFACSWTCEDVALLDEAAELLGEDTTEKDREEAREKAERKELLSYAKEAMNGMGLGRGFFTAQALADRWQEEAEVLTVAEQAEADRSWVYGHIIADEAQELSPMVWRILMRRCPSRSMTLVGDTDQASSANPVCSWKETLEQYASGRYRVEALTVNYRTPSQMMDLASRMLKESGRIPGGVESVREAEVAPRFLEYGSLNFEDLAAVLTAELDLLGAGRLAVVLPSIPGAYKLPCPRDVASGLSNILGPGVCESGASGLDVPVVVLTAEQVKGLEFDSVVVVDPLSIYELAPSDLYVTTTRPTQRLTILHPGSLPPGYGA